MTYHDRMTTLLCLQGEGPGAASINPRLSTIGSGTMLQMMLMDNLIHSVGVARQGAYVRPAPCRWDLRETIHNDWGTPHEHQSAHHTSLHFIMTPHAQDLHPGNILVRLTPPSGVVLSTMYGVLDRLKRSNMVGVGGVRGLCEE